MDLKSELYRRVEGIRRELFLTGNEPLGEMKLAAYGARGTVIREVPFRENTLCGLSVPGHPDIILLSENKPECVKRFALAHELIHISLHREKPGAFMLSRQADGSNGQTPPVDIESVIRVILACLGDGSLSYEEAKRALGALAYADPTAEREANAGAAELLMPWRSFLPMMLDFRASLGMNRYDTFTRFAARQMRVSRQAAEIRARELWHPMEVYLRAGDWDAAEAALNDTPAFYDFDDRGTPIPHYSSVS